jgi:hypothetical protein
MRRPAWHFDPPALDMRASRSASAATVDKESSRFTHNVNHARTARECTEPSNWMEQEASKNAPRHA